MNSSKAHALAATLAMLAGIGAHVDAQAAPAADLVITGARIYTADAKRSLAEALAVRDGKLVFVGSNADAAKWVGPGTKTQKLAGRLILPGLIDSHLHPLGIADADQCDLKSEPKSLRELTAFVRACIEHYGVPEGEWMNVRQWNAFGGNEPDAEYATLRAALDRASGKHLIQLLGNDGHHGAFNSAALAQARDRTGKVAGLSKASLATTFAEYARLVGVDQHGEPNGAVSEDARDLMANSMLLDLGDPAIMKARNSITQRLNAAGITGIMDAAAAAPTLPVYDALVADGKLTVRTTLAQFYDPKDFRTASGAVDYARMVAAADKVRTKYATHPLIRANFVKLFADGVIEGNPFTTPPTQPHAAMLRPFLQPIFGKDSNGKLTVTGYVDTASAVCADVRAHPQKFREVADIDRFTAQQGYHPAQCAISSGQLQHERAVIMEFARRFHLAGYTLHIHAISDLGVRTALDAIEAARAADGISTQHDSLSHIQIARPEDVVRIGRNRLYVAFTYGWGSASANYDLMVIPFIDKVAGNRFEDLYPADGYYAKNVYPFRAVKQAGGVLVAGSDAPVGTWDPMPFANMATGVTRRSGRGGWPAQNPSQSIPVRDVIDAYTINGARFLSRESESGSLEVGKSADFIVVDRDILELADRNSSEQIAGTQVLQTWFMGKAVYERPAQEVSSK